MSGVDIEGLKDYKSLFLYPQHWAGLVCQGRFYCYGWYGNGNGRWDIKKILGILWERSGFFTLRGALLLVFNSLGFFFLLHLTTTGIFYSDRDTTFVENRICMPFRPFGHCPTWLALIDLVDCFRWEATDGAGYGATLQRLRPQRRDGLRLTTMADS